MTKSNQNNSLAIYQKELDLISDLLFFEKEYQKYLKTKELEDYKEILIDQEIEKSWNLK